MFSSLTGKYGLRERADLRLLAAERLARHSGRSRQECMSLLSVLEMSGSPEFELMLQRIAGSPDDPGRSGDSGVPSGHEGPAVDRQSFASLLEDAARVESLGQAMVIRARARRMLARMG